MALVSLVEFFLFACIGWILDSTFRSIENRSLSLSGYFHGIPLCPLYGFGGILLLQTFMQMYGYPPVSTILVATFVLIGVEYLGGIFAQRYLQERLWDYSKELLNIDGYISLFHSLIWLLLVTIVYLYISPILFSMHRFLLVSLRSYEGYTLPIFAVCLLIAAALTAETKKKRLQASRRISKKRFKS